MRSRGKDGIDEERTYEVTRVVKNHMVDGTPSRIVDALLPYGLFFIGMWAGQYLWVMALFGTPIHEMGHVIAAFATGGYGAWDIGAVCELEGVIPGTDIAYHVRGRAGGRGPQVCGL